MEWLGSKDDTIFMGQSVKYSGNAIYNTLSTLDDGMKECVEHAKRIGL